MTEAESPCVRVAAVNDSSRRWLAVARGLTALTKPNHDLLIRCRAANPFITRTGPAEERQRDFGRQTAVSGGTRADGQCLCFPTRWTRRDKLQVASRCGERPKNAKSRRHASAWAVNPRVPGSG